MSYEFARELDHRYAERKAAHKPIPHDTFTRNCYRQPSLTEADVLPEPYRNDGTYDILRSAETGESVVLADWRGTKVRDRAKHRLGTLSINVHELADEGEEDVRVLQRYFEDYVLPLSEIPKEESDSDDEERQHEI